jgi:beta-mannosidase
LLAYARPEPFKYIHFPDPQDVGLEAAVGADGESVTLSARKPVKGIVLDVDGDAEVRWGDQAIDLVPGDPQTVTAVGLGSRPVKVRFLGDGTA